MQSMVGSVGVKQKNEGKWQDKVDREGLTEVVFE